MKVLLLLAFVTLAACGQQQNYDGYTVYRMYPNTEEQRSFLSNMQDSPDLDFWSDVNRLDMPVDVMVKPEKTFEFLMNVRNAGITATVFIENVQSLIEQQITGRFTPGSRMTWTQYYDLNSINAWMDQLATTYPNVVTVVNGGSSYQGRQIKGVKIALNPGKRVIFLEGGIHAREWISPATMTYIINEVLTTTDPVFKKIAESFEWHIFPSTNPDGYVYTHSGSRLWRKTMKPYGICSGADPNRNWNAHWLEQGASTNPCSETYAGSSPFSEVETATLGQYIKSVASRMDVYLSFHSYSQLFLLPYGHTTQPLDNYSEMMQIGRKAISALSQRYGTSYRIGNIAEAIYPASGGSIDWVKQEFKTNVVACYELRDTGRYGFLLPANQIIPNSLEVMDSLIALIQEAEKFGYVTIG